MIYLDHAAATPLAPNVYKAVQPYQTEKFFNASAGYLSAKAVAKDIQQAREKIARVLGSRAAEIIFTAGGTEANNLAIHGALQAFPGSSVAVSSIEHDSVLEPANTYDTNVIKVRPNGIIDIDDVKQKIDHKTVLVSVMYVNNEIGTIQPISEISKLIESIRTERIKSGHSLPLYLHTDACQAGNYLHLLVDRLGVDMMTINAGKLYGPKQAGVLYVKTGVKLSPQILGGGQEWGMRSGTENPVASIGMAEALETAQTIRGEEATRLSELRTHFIKLLLTKVPSARLTSNVKHIIPNNIHVTFPGQDNERLMMALDEAGIIVAVGSACSASSDEPSHVLKAIGKTDDESRSSLRLTMGRSTTKSDLEKTVAAIAKLIV